MHVWHNDTSNFLNHSMKTLLKNGFSTSLSWHKPVNNLSNSLSCPPCANTNILSEGVFLFFFFFLIHQDSVNSGYFPKSGLLCHFINYYTNRGRGLWEESRKPWSGQSNNSSTSFLSLKALWLHSEVCSLSLGALQRQWGK